MAGWVLPEKRGASELRAAWYERYGPAREVFHVGELPDPEPGPGEVLVRVKASGVNPSDWKSRIGSRGPQMLYPLVVPHSDGAGVIESVGSGVDGTRVGSRVWLFEGQWQRPLGTAAEFIALPSEHAVDLPSAVGFEEGACIGIPAMTAHRCLFATGPVEGMTVLVTGGAGAVGHYGIQLAKWGGATVIATISSDEKAKRAIQSGADHTLNYKTDDVIKGVMDLTAGRGVDRIVEVDFGGNLAVSMEIMKLNGAIGCYASTGDREPRIDYQAFSRKNTTVNFVLVYSEPNAAKLQAVEDITRGMAAGSLTHPIATTMPLEEIAAAHELQESNAAIGNIILVP